MLEALKTAWRFEQEWRWWALCVSTILTATMIAVMTVALYWAFFDTPVPLENHLDPIPIRTSPETGEVFREFCFTKHTDASFDLTIEVIRLTESSEFRVASQHIAGAGSPPVSNRCGEAPMAFDSFDPGLYRLDFRTVYRINPLRSRAVEISSVPFEWSGG